MAGLVIFGTGDIAKLAHYYFVGDAGRTVDAFVVDRPYLTSADFCGVPVVAQDEVVSRYPPDQFEMFVALSYARMNRLRMERYLTMKEAGYRLATYVSSRCSYLAQQPPGDNCFILEDNTIQPFVTIGNNVTLWSGNHIGHDSTIEDHCFIASHVVVSGHVRIGERSFLGVNATVRNSVTIAPATLVGAGATIMKDTQPGDVFLAPRVVHHPRRSEDVDL